MAAATAPASETVPQEGAPAAPTPSLGNSSLYVGDLDREVSEAQLFELFSQIGPVASIRVCRDTVTRRSLGYAYVNYNSTLDPTAAERALETLNYAPLNGKPMRLMWSHRDPASRRSGVGNIFIKNLDKDIDNKALHDTFSAFGNILSCKVALDANGQSKGYGFVHYETDESAEQAIEKVNGMLLEGKKVYVGPFVKRSDRPDNAEVRFTNVFVKNLADSVTEEQLEGLFSKYGVVTSVVVMKEDDGKSRGFGFVNFEDADSARAAVDALNGQEFEGKEMFCGRAQKKSEREAALKQKFDEIRQERVAKYQGMNLYIKNLTDEVDDDKLRAEFEPFGTITSAKVMKDNNGKSKGFGFVCFTSPEEATKAVTDANGKMLHGKPMYVALAQRRDVRKAQLEQQYTQRMPGMGPAAGGRGPGGPMGGPGMFPMGGANPMFYQAQANGMGGRGGGFGYPQMMGRGPGMKGGRGGRGRMGPAADFGMMGPGGFGPGGFGPGGPMGGPGGFPGRGGRGGRGRMGPAAMGGRGDMYGPEAGFGGPMGGPGMMGPDGYGPGPMGPGGRGGRGRGPGPEMGGRGLGRGPTGRGPAGPGGRGPGAMGAPPPPAPAPTAPSAVVPGQEGSGGLTTAMLAAAPPEQQKQMLGERLFPLVQRLQPELAGKITGMLLEMDNSELLLLLESPEALAAKVDEAIQVLKQHNALPDGINPDAAKASA